MREIYSRHNASATPMMMMVAIGLLFTLATAKADTITQAKMLETLFKDEATTIDHFDPFFLAQVPADEITRIVVGMKQNHGALLRVEPSGNDFFLRFEQVKISARITLNADGRITGLWFSAPQPEGDIEAQVATIKALPGRTSVLVLTDGKPVAAHNAENPLAVGSAAKLAILLAVKQAVADGRLAWEGVVKIDKDWKSLPSGQLQDWPDGAPVTIATLSHLMISVSDNTATDALISLVKREAVEALSHRNIPFLTTREAFTLKSNGTTPLRTEWRNGDAVARRAILNRIRDALLPAPDEISTMATHEVEWFMTAQELCSALDATADLPSLGINMGPVNRENWQSVAYKGGSEVGVLNLSSRVVGRDGSIHCVAATWNDNGPIDEGRLVLPYRAILDRLAMPKN